MKRRKKRIPLLVFLLIFLFSSLQPAPVLAVEAVKKWRYQWELQQFPQSGSEQNGKTLHMKLTLGMVQLLKNSGFLEKIQGLFSDEKGKSKEDSASVLPQVQKVPVGKKWPKPKRVKELVKKRKQNVKFHELSDGRIEAEISTTPVHYKDKKGKWQNIDLSIGPSQEEAGYEYASTKNTFQSFFSSKLSSSFMKMKWGKHQLKVGVEKGNALSRKPEIKGNQITYFDLFPDTKVNYEVFSDSVKEKIILEKVPQDFTFQYSFEMEGMKAHQQNDGSIAFVSTREDRALFTIPKPFMYDSQNDPSSPYGKTWSPKVTQKIEQNGSRAILTITADQNWLKDPKRKYPVVIDPTIVIQPTPGEDAQDSQDTMITSSSPNSNFNESWKMSVGSDPAQTSRALVKFDLSGIEAGTQIDSARVELYYDQQFCNGCASGNTDNQVSFSLHRVLQDWDPKTVTWNQAKEGVPWESPGGYYKADLEFNQETVDNRDDSSKVAANGQWLPVRAIPEDAAYKGSYHISDKGDGTDTFTWVPHLTESGTYQFNVHYPGGSGRATNAPFTVYHANGSTKVEVDQSASGSHWVTKGYYTFNAGDSHKIVLSDLADGSVVADAVQLVKNGTATKYPGDTNKWHSYSMRSLAQDWINGTQPNYGVLIKVRDESQKLGGVHYTASSNALYYDENTIRPKLVITYGKPGVELDEPTKIHSTGAELSWSPYTGDDFVEYQVHRSTEQNFEPDEDTLVAPIEDIHKLSFTDTTAEPTPALNSPVGRVYPEKKYFYMIAVKTADGQLLPSETRFVSLPKAGLTREILRSSGDVTLSSSKPTANLDTIDGNPWLTAGNYSETYGTTRSAIKFDLSSLPVGAKVVQSRLGLWEWQRVPENTSSSPANYTVHAVTKDFTESATWNSPWSQPGGDFESTSLSAKSMSDEPQWKFWDTTPAVQAWMNRTKQYYGFVVRHAHESGTVKERTMFLGSETPTRSLRPKLEVTYTEQSAARSYYAPDTPVTMLPGTTYEAHVTLTNTTNQTWSGANDRLSYHWVLPSGEEVTSTDNRLETSFRPIDENGLEAPTPVDIAPGESITVKAKIKAPALNQGTIRQGYTLRWDIRQSGQWLSQSSDPVATLDQKVVVENEQDGKALGSSAAHVDDYAGPNSKAGVNLYKGNVSFAFTPFSNPSKGFDTYVHLTYNSLDDHDSVLGRGWSIATNSQMSLGAPVNNAAMVNQYDQIVSGSVVLIDEEGGSHTFTYDTTQKKFVAPPGTNMYLRYLSGSNKRKKWVVTESNRTSYYFDELGYVTEAVDKNGNKLTFTYEERKIDNKPAKLLRYITDSDNRRTLTITYNSKNKIQHIDDVAGRRTLFSYDSEGRLVKIYDGLDTNERVINYSRAKTYQFTYHSTLKSLITKITDPRGHDTLFNYMESGADKNKVTEMTNRAGELIRFGYNGNERIVTDPKLRQTRYLFDARGRKVAVTDANNKVTKYGYDNDDNLTRLEEPNGAVTTWSYEENGLPLTKVDAENNALEAGAKKTVYQYSYTLDNRVADLVKETSPEGKTITYTYDNQGNVTSRKDAYGNETKYTYYQTSNGKNTGLLKTITDANNRVTTYGDPNAPDFGYHPTGQPKKIKDALGNVTTFTYGPRGEVLTITDAKGKTTTKTYDIFGRPLTTKVPKETAIGKYITTPAPVYDKNDNIVSKTAPNGAVTSYTYDEMDRVTSEHLPRDADAAFDRIKKYQYNEVGKLVKEIEPKGTLTPDQPDDYVTTYEYNNLDQLTSVTNSLGDKITYEYDDVGNQIKVTLPKGQSTPDDNDYSVRKTYDKNHRVIQEIDANGNYTHFTYDADGSVTRIKDKDGNLTYKFYDLRGLLTEERVSHDEGKVRVTKYHYDKVGNLTEVETPRGTETATEGDYVQKKVYDALNRVKEIIYPRDPSSGNVHFRAEHKLIYNYDSVGNLVEVSAPPSYGQTERNVTKMSYFDNGWIKTIEDPWQMQTSYQYNDLGLETERTVLSPDRSLLRKMTWDYHPDGKLKKSYDSGVKSNSDSPVFIYKYFEHRYDANGNLTETKDLSTGATVDLYRMDYNAVNQVSTVEEIDNDVVKRKIEYEYDENGNLFMEIYPGRRSYYYYNTVNLVESMATNNGDPASPYQWTDYLYTPSGLIKQETQTNGNVTTYDYYQDHLLKQMEMRKADGTTLQKHVLEYNANGHRIKDTYTGLDAGKQLINNVYTYEYDPRDRLVNYQKTGSQTASESYLLDPNSNIIEKTQNGKVTTYQYDKNHLISQTKDGVTSQYQYDPMGRIS
ncbi:DNRLRE domain-containing protein, partial [Paenactinomyces guangxiensis]